MRKRLNKRLAVGGDFGPFPIAASGTLVFQSLLFLTTDSPALLFTLTPAQSFRIVAPWVQIVPDSNPDVGLLSVFNAQFLVRADPLNNNITIYAFSVGTIVNPLGTAGIAFSESEIPELLYSDYQQQLGFNFTQVGIDVIFDGSNSDAVTARNFDINVGAVVEVYDDWAEMPGVAERIGYGGPVRFPTS
jgi:hypothetical protein